MGGGGCTRASLSKGVLEDVERARVHLMQWAVEGCTCASLSKGVLDIVARYAMILAGTRIQYRIQYAYQVRRIRVALARTSACRVKPVVGGWPISFLSDIATWYFFYV